MAKNLNQLLITPVTMEIMTKIGIDENRRYMNKTAKYAIYLSTL
jgi:hypothetical protein